jgi:hypothetical protein
LKDVLKTKILKLYEIDNDYCTKILHKMICSSLKSGFKWTDTQDSFLQIINKYTTELVYLYEKNHTIITLLKEESDKKTILKTAFTNTIVNYFEKCFIIDIFSYSKINIEQFERYILLLIWKLLKGFDNNHTLYIWEIRLNMILDFNCKNYYHRTPYDDEVNIEHNPIIISDRGFINKIKAIRQELYPYEISDTQMILNLYVHKKIRSIYQPINPIWFLSILNTNYTNKPKIIGYTITEEYYRCAILYKPNSSEIYIPDKYKTGEFIISCILINNKFADSYRSKILLYYLHKNMLVTKELVQLLDSLKITPKMIQYYPKELITFDMCLEYVKKSHCPDLNFIPEEYKNNKNIYEIAIKKDPHNLRYLDDKLKTETMCKKSVKKCFYTHNYVPEKYKTRELFDTKCKLCDIYDCCNDIFENYPKNLLTEKRIFKLFFECNNANFNDVLNENNVYDYIKIIFLSKNDNFNKSCNIETIPLILKSKELYEKCINELNGFIKMFKCYDDF